MRILVGQINPIIGDLKGNTAKIMQGIALAKEQGIDLLLFPELCLTGYPPEDFLLMPHFIDAAESALKMIVEASKGLTVIVGTVRRNHWYTEKQLYNSAAVIVDGELIGYQDKTLLPTYDVFDERRYFEPANQVKVWDLCGQKVAITICEDIWQHSEQLTYTTYRSDPIEGLRRFKPDLLLNLSASPYSFNRVQNRLAACTKAAHTLLCPVILCNQVGGNDSLIFDGYSLVVGKEGQFCQYAKGFVEDWMVVDLSQPQNAVALTNDPLEDLYKALVLGVRDYFHKSGFLRACLGLSGGIDSALVACIAVEALGKEHVLALGLPSRYTSEESVSDAQTLATRLGIEFQTLSIEGPFESFLELLEKPFENHAADVTEENLQARIRGMLLMAISNKLGYIVLSTGNKSELAMGYSTLYGDMCGGLAVISDLTKQQVYALSHWLNRNEALIPANILIRPPTAELRPNQKDSDSLPDYLIVDNVLQEYIEGHHSTEEIAKKFGYDLSLVEDLVRRIHRNEYKRRQSPPGLRISEKAFSVGRHFPIVQKYI